VIFTNELVMGVALGTLGLGVAATARRWDLDWGLIWAVMALLALTWTTPRWTGSFVTLRNPLLAVMATVAVISITITVQRGTGVGGTPLPFLASMLGIWVTVPDTEPILVLLGLTGSMAIAWRPLRWAQARWPGGMLMAAVTALAVMAGGRGRASSIVGALGAMAVIGLLAHRPWREPSFAPLLQHVVLVVWWARVAGRAESPATALLLGLGLSIPVVGVSWWLTRRRRSVVSAVEASPE
jgi:hypothetical protein